MTVRQDNTDRTDQDRQRSPQGFSLRSSVAFKLAIAYIACSVLSTALALEISYVFEELVNTNLVILLVFAMQVFYALVLSRRFGESLRTTADMVERLAAGDLEHPIEVMSSDEIGQVQASVEKMRRSLLGTINALDERVGESVRELQYHKMALDEHAILAVTDTDGLIREVNDKFCEVSGYSRDELIGQNHNMLSSGKHPPELFEKLYQTIESGGVWHYEVCNKNKSGDLYWIDSTIVPATDEDGMITRYTSISTDITAMKLAQERLAIAVHGSRDGLWDWNLATDDVYYSAQFCKLLGLAENDLDSNPSVWISMILSEDLANFQARLESHIKGHDDDFECEIRMMHADGDPRWMLCRGAALRGKDGVAVRIAGSLVDITEIKNAQRELKDAEEHDSLTGLPNRVLFQKHIDRALEQCQKDPARIFSVLYFDFDRFKVVNDSLGHDIGDQLLISIAKRFEKHIRPFDVAARFGGDEYAVLLNNLGSEEEAHEIAYRLLEVLSEPYEIDGHTIRSTASIGLVTSEMECSGVMEIMRDADAAMYQAKNAGRARVVTYDVAMHQQALDQISLEEDLGFAIERDELRLFYQPIINLESGDLVGFEALVRWEHPTRGLVSPDDFIGIAEDNGFIVPMGDWILRTACAQIKAWNEMLPSGSPLFMNVNFSKRQLLHPDCVEKLRQAFMDYDLDPTVVKIEITESTIVENRTDIISTLMEIRDLGFRLAMDDFGTGHSSLSGLHRFPIDILKIDRSFIASIEQSSELAAVVHSIVTLAQNLGMDIVAEGIETQAQTAILQSQEVTFGQGFLFSKPLPADAAEAYMTRQFGSRRAA